VELLASLHCRKWLLEPGVNAPSLFLRIQGGLSDSPLWMARRPGLFGPVFRWHVVDLKKPVGS
jgi:lipopolysaccharide transport system ATP-binding protein